jgi:hypothetical protein
VSRELNVLVSPFGGPVVAVGVENPDSWCWGARAVFCVCQKFALRAGKRREMIEQTVEELAPLVGTRPACRALGVAPATIYRRRRPPQPRPSRPRSLPARALSGSERELVLGVGVEPRLRPFPQGQN